MWKWGLARAVAGTVLSICIVAVLATTATGETVRRARLGFPELGRFESEDEFKDYLRAARRDAVRRGLYWKGAPRPVPKSGVYIGKGGLEAVVVSAHKAEDKVLNTPVASVEDSITNNQERGVDEGDVVKRIGRFLVVLQDGRLFSIDMGTGEEPLALVDRANVYRHAKMESWIDEVLVFGRRILVTGYSYEIDATELTAFSLGADGRLTREGAYYLSSNDYYDSGNYATRIIGGDLVIYTPLYLPDVDPNEPLQWPLIRKWLRDDERKPVMSDGRRLFDARSIYRPLRAPVEPTVHTITICPLGRLAGGDEVTCRSTGFVGPENRQFYVTPDEVFVWAYENEGESGACRSRDGKADWEGDPAQVFRIPIIGRSVKAVLAEGAPQDQFGLDAAKGELRAMLLGSCAEQQLALLRAPLMLFDEHRPTRASRDRYMPMPDIDGDGYVNRFTDDYLVYGAHSTWWGEPPHEGAKAGEARLVAVRLDGSKPMVLTAPHEISRIEPLAGGMILTGYAARDGLSISRLDLTMSPRLTDTLLLKGRYETEGRSHAFNSRAEQDGSGLFALPTAAGQDDNTNRLPWESEDSDISFLGLAPSGKLRSMGVLTRGAEADPSYECEVSCIDWYGNARPIFIAGRIFALTGAELVEGRIESGAIREVRRINLTRPPARHRPQD